MALKIVLSLMILISCSVVCRGQRTNMDSLMQHEEKWRDSIRETAIGKKYGYTTLLAKKTQTGLQQLNDKIIFINFWFATCAPCIAEFNGLNELYTKIGKKKNFKFISFSYENDSTIAQVRQKYGILYDIFHISQEECQRMSILAGYPRNLLIDRNMIVKNVYLGGWTNAAQSKEFILTKILPEIDELLNTKNK